MAEQGTATVPVTDRAFLYGDGLFETLLIVNGVPLWPDLHLDRLMLGAERLRIELCVADVQHAITEAQVHYHDAAGILRITVSRNGGLRGYAPSRDVGSRVTSVHSQLGREPFGALPDATVVTSTICMGEQPLLAGVKHCNRLEQVMAAAEAQHRGVDDVLLCRSDGAYQCSSNANIFVVCEDSLLTPNCERSGVLGTRRRLILEQLSVQLGLRAAEASLTATDLKAADALFICNSIMGIRNIAQWDDCRFQHSAAVEQLQHAYQKEAQRCCAI